MPSRSVKFVTASLKSMKIFALPPRSSFLLRFAADGCYWTLTSTRGASVWVFQTSKGVISSDADGCEGISAAHSLQHLVHLVLSVAPAHVILILLPLCCFVSFSKIRCYPHSSSLLAVFVALLRFYFTLPQVSRSLVKKHKRCSQPRRRARAGRPTGCPCQATSCKRVRSLKPHGLSGSLHHRPPEAAAGSWQSSTSYVSRPAAVD
eukprot:765942-Hanusia_phi.AAC.6